MSNSVFKIITNCIPIKGYGRSIILDLQRKTFNYIPNSLYYFIKKNNNKVIDFEKVKKSNNIIKSYINFLKKKEYLFEGLSEKNELNLFPSLNIKFSKPYIVDYIVIIDNINILDKISKLNYYFINYNCEIIFTSIPTHENIKYLKKILTRDVIISLSIIIVEDFKISIQYIIKQFSNISTPVSIYYSTCFNDDNIYIPITSALTLIKNSAKIQLPDNTNSQININQFGVNQDLFLESINHNTYFNKKIFFDKDGNLKNAISSIDNFGQFELLQTSDKLLKIISSAIFQKYWLVSKKNIDVCRDCEYKNICIDNRLPKKRNKDEWYFEKECNYNPYISKWKNEKGYLTLLDCHVKSDKYGFIINRKKINEINKKLWVH